MQTHWVVFAGAMVGWFAYFYGIDLMIMGAQGLPVGWDLMPK